MSETDETKAESSPAEQPTGKAPEEPGEQEYQAPDVAALTPDEYQTWLASGEFPTPKKEAPAPSDEKPEASPDTGPGENKESEAPKKAEKKTQNADTRATELEAEIAELKRAKAERIQKLLDERRQLRQEQAKTPEPQPGPKPERPKRPKYQDYEDKPDQYEEALDKYEEELADYKAQQRIEAERQKAAQEQRRQIAFQRNAEVRKAWETRLTATKQRHEDFQQVVNSVDLPLNPIMDGFLLESEVGPEMVYHLCSNVADAERIAKLQPFACARELTRLEAQISDALKTPAKPTILTAAKPPGTQLSGMNRAPEDEAEAAIDAGDVERYMRVMNQRDIARITGK